ncbi:MAG: DUF4328 domain-containing protein [Catenulispora sp.]|nr:DUF4328 domain-containing protein [Catenulispora sp.]
MTHQQGYPQPTPYGPGLHVPGIRTSVGGLATALTILLSLDGAFALLSTVGLAWRSSLLGKLLDDTGSVEGDSLDSADNLISAGDGLLALTTVATIVVFMCWFWAARNNAESYAPNRGTMGASWSIAGWFIPVAWWVLPFIVARDVYKGTMSGRQDRRQHSGGYITGWWWASFVAAWLLLLGVSSANQGTKDADSAYEYLKAMRRLTNTGLVALPVLTVSAVLAICYVLAVTKVQKQRNAEGDWYDGPASRGAQGLAPWPAPGYGYGYGAPVPGGYPMPMPAPPVQAPPTQAPPMQAPPVQDAVPAAETQTAEVVDEDPFAAPRDGLTPPS